MMMRVVLAAEQYKGVASGSFKISLARPALSFAHDLLLEIFSGVMFHFFFLYASQNLCL
jgi:hypothetical protein